MRKAKERVRLEAWVPIAGYEGYYEVSDLGRVRSALSRKLKEQSGGPGTSVHYFYVTLYRGNVGKKVRVHRLVAEHFIPNPKGYPYVLHKNDDRTMNMKSNLKWGTQTHNHLDAVRNGTYKRPPVMRGAEHPSSKLNEKKVLKIRKLREKGKSQEWLASRFNVGRGAIRGVLEGKSWRHV